jgi:hypothetical protein
VFFPYKLWIIKIQCLIQKIITLFGALILKVIQKWGIFFHKSYWYIAITPAIKISNIDSNEIIINLKIIKSDPWTLIRFELPPFVGMTPIQTEKGIDIKFFYQDISTLNHHKIPSVHVYQMKILS